jgi:PleD family two-component response regulator
MTGPKQTQSINSVAIRIQEAFRPAWYWEGQKLKIGVSIGISFSTATSDVQSLLGQADSAMYTAKNTGKAKYVMFDASAMSLN